MHYIDIFKRFMFWIALVILIKYIWCHLIDFKCHHSGCLVLAEKSAVINDILVAQFNYMADFGHCGYLLFLKINNNVRHFERDNTVKRR